MKHLILFSALILFNSVFSANAEEIETSLEVKNQVCDAMEFAIDHSEDYDNDIYHCASGYARSKCLSSDIHWRDADRTAVDFDAVNFTCNCGVHVLQTPHPKSGLLLDIGGCL